MTEDYALHGWRVAIPQDQSVRHFFPQSVGKRRTVGFLHKPAFDTMFLAAEPTIKLPAIQVYVVTAAAIDGLNIGYLFYSPIKPLLDGAYCMWARQGVQSSDFASPSAEVVHQYNLRGDVSVFIGESATLMTVYLPSTITENLDS